VLKETKPKSRKNKGDHREEWEKQLKKEEEKKESEQDGQVG